MASVVGAGALVGAGAAVMTAVAVAAGAHEAKKSTAMTSRKIHPKVFIITTSHLQSYYELIAYFVKWYPLNAITYLSRKK
jgi:hypothetical protein